MKRHFVWAASFNHFVLLSSFDILIFLFHGDIVVVLFNSIALINFNMNHMLYWQNEH